MSDPTRQIQFSVMAAIRAAAPALTAVYDRVNPSAAYPYANVDSPVSVPIDEECWDRWEVTMQINVWDDLPSSSRVKDIAPLITSALNEQTISVAGHVIDRMQVEGVFYSREDDTLINRARIQLAIELQPTS